MLANPPVLRSQKNQSSEGAMRSAALRYSDVRVSIAGAVPSSAKGACNAPVLMAVIRSNCGIGSWLRSRHPRRNPTPNAPFWPPPDNSSTSTVWSGRAMARRASRAITVSRRARSVVRSPSASLSRVLIVAGGR
jgi:hypothetical protein